MPDRDKVIEGLESCIANNCRDCPYPCYCEYADDWPHELHKDALELLKEQEALLNKAYKLLADMELDICCDDLMCDDGWCDEHCTTNGPMPECIERWMRKQIAEGR